MISRLSTGLLPAQVTVCPACAQASVGARLQSLRDLLLSPSPGLLNLEKLLRQFLISKDTLSVRMLDDTRDPTPLLKEIRDDKTATIIIHANASMSHTILLKVGAGLGGWWASFCLPPGPRGGGEVRVPGGSGGGWCT